jgi:hypothetical protein
MSQLSKYPLAWEITITKPATWTEGIRENILSEWRAYCVISSFIVRHSKKSHFFVDRISSMAAMGNTCFWLIEIRKNLPEKLLSQMGCKLVGMMYRRSSTKLLICRSDFKQGRNGQYLFLIGRNLRTTSSQKLLRGRPFDFMGRARKIFWWQNIYFHEFPG